MLPLVASMTVWPGLSAPRALGVLDDGARHAVLDRAHRVEGLELDVDVDARRRELVEAHHRRVADGVEDVVVTGHGCSVGETRYAEVRSASVPRFDYGYGLGHTLVPVASVDRADIGHRFSP